MARGGRSRNMRRGGMGRAAMLLSLAMLATALPGCIKPDPPDDTQGYDYDLLWKIGYATNFRFQCPYGHEAVIFNGCYYDGCYDELVFVMSESEATGYPDNVNVAWPTERTEESVRILNEYIELYGYDPTPYSLTYSVTVEDVVLRWEDVDDLMLNGVSPSARDRVFGF
jgi:hypothetical protein